MKVKEALFKLFVFQRDTDKKPIVSKLNTFLGIWLKNKTFTIHYIGRPLNRNDYKIHHAFLDMKQCLSIVFSKSNNQEAYGDVLNNKLFFAISCAKNDLPTPSTIGYDLKGYFFYEGNVRKLDSLEEVIENMESGGFIVLVNQNISELMDNGIRAMIFGATQFSNHSDTNFLFEGFKVPYSSEASEMSAQFSSCFPFKLNDWDIAITPEGPTMLEGNQYPVITMGEMAYGGYVNHPLFQQMISNTL